MTAGRRDQRDIVRVADFRPNPSPGPAPTPRPPSRPRTPRRWMSVLRWAVGLLIVVGLVVALGKSIPAAPRPTLGPASVSPSSSR